MIYTFYSYKGGVGRSMALANIAELFYKQGLRVLIIDWDLEAPGLERFYPNQLDAILEHKGLIEIFLEYKMRMSQERTTMEKIDALVPDLSEYIIDISSIKSKTTTGRMFLLPSGKRDGSNFSEYAYHIKSFDWQDFYENWEGELFIEWLRRQFENIADVILIDSRTGVTEMGGVCLYQLADVAVMLCAPNQQNIEGIHEIANSLIQTGVQESRYGRELSILVIPSRVEDRAESDLLSEFRDEFLTRFSRFTPEIIRSYISSLWDFKIPHVPFFAFKEMIATQDSEDSRSEDLVQAYNSIFNALARLSLPTSDIYKKTFPTRFEKYQVKEDVSSIALWGPSGSGKDWLIRGFAKELQYFNQSYPEFTFELYDEDDSPIMPIPPASSVIPGTLAPEDFVLKFVRRPSSNKNPSRAQQISAFTHQIILHNDAGGNLLSILVDQNASTLQTLIDSQYIIVLLDPTHITHNIKQLDIETESKAGNKVNVEKKVLDDFEKGDDYLDLPEIARKTIFTREEYTKTVRFLLMALSKNPTQKRYLAICLTKMDKIRMKGDSWTLLKRLFGQEMHDLLITYKKGFEIEVFATSAAGFIKDKNDNMVVRISNEVDGHIKDPAQWQPVNTATPFFWIFENREKEKIKSSEKFLSNNLKYYIEYPRRGF